MFTTVVTTFFTCLIWLSLCLTFDICCLYNSLYIVFCGLKVRDKSKLKHLCTKSQSKCIETKYMQMKSYFPSKSFQDDYNMEGPETLSSLLSRIQLSLKSTLKTVSDLVQKQKPHCCLTDNQILIL